MGHGISTFRRLLNDQYLWLCGLKKSYIVRMRNVHKQEIPTFWWQDPENGIVNFGDEITADIVRTLFGYKCRLASIDECILIGVGSILEIAHTRTSQTPMHIWGSGFINNSEGDKYYNFDKSNFIFHAVRGSLTAKRLGGVGVLGDPGLLASLVYKKSNQPIDKIGVVAHYADGKLPIVAKIRDDSRFILINPLDSPQEVAYAISSCKLILSSSLHGLIFSDSFGVPNIHLKLSDNLTGGTYKFQDYYSVTGRDYIAADISLIFDDEYLDNIIRNYLQIKNIRSIQRKLIKSFPKFP